MIVVESQYFPPIEFFTLIKNESEICIDGFEYFGKQTYRNRCYVLTSNKTLSLSVPLQGANKKILTKDINIDYSENWIKDHWRAITSAYNRSPYFEYYEAYLHKIIHAKSEKLIELNDKILSFCLEVLQIDAKITYSEKYIEKSNNAFIDYRSVIHPKISYVHRKIYEKKEYTQTFGNNFASNLSILDLIFCCGPESKKNI